MSLLKKKFGKVAVSSETSRNVRGGNMDLDPWGDDGGGTGGSSDVLRHVYCCSDVCDGTCRSSKSTADRICGGRSVSKMCAGH